LHLPSVVSTVLAAYLALVANVGLVTLVLSPFHAVSAAGLVAAEAVVCAGAFAGWWLRGRPVARVRFPRIDALTVLMLAVLACVLAYELLLALTVPANNWDALTYHLARAAFWAQHHGIEWITNAPSDRLNEFQPLAEQEILFLLVAGGSTALYALPQYVAELAILVAVYGTARRLGFGVRGAVGSACLLATFALVALEATTAQNDLVAASFVAVATCLMLGTTRTDGVLAGVALGVGLGVKLTSLLVWPVLALLAWSRGRATAVCVLAGACGGFAAVGLGGYVLNLKHTGHLLGYGASRTENTTSPSFPGSLHVGLRVLYRLFDLSSLSNRLIEALAIVGIVAAAAVFARTRRFDSVWVALPFLSPLVVLAAAHTLAFVARLVDLPVADGSYFGHTNRRANEDYAAFGPLGAVLLIGTAAWIPIAYVRRRADRAQLALALALPCFLVLLALQSKWNGFLTRFSLVAVVLVAPLFARFFRSAAVTVALIVTGAVIAFVTLRDDLTKPAAAHPWTFNQAQALARTWQPAVGSVINEYRRDVPSHACVGAIVGPDEPSYVLWGPKLPHRVYYLPSIGGLPQAFERGLFYVVISAAANAPSADAFEAAGWRIRPIAGYWLLATAPHAGAGECG
jgi:Dolichyl-phosphate-mannose-protein mannosyltransferase